MTEPSPATVPLALLSEALNEIYALREACAYEAGANQATMDMKIPDKARAVLTEVNDGYLILAASGRARDISIPGAQRLDRRTWEAMRHLSVEGGVTRFHSDHTAPEPLYLAALEEIGALRAVAKKVSKTMPDVLLSRSLPTSRRAVVTGQINRLKDCWRGRVDHAYAAMPYRYLTHAMTSLDLSTLFTRTTFEDEQAAREARATA